ncbi:MAG: peptide deformylase [Epsilonproteobacteria bacterium]|nr:peptide deformylase [Campylobacterota bacterium]
MVRDILIYPDPKLKQISTEVEEFNSYLHDLLDDMYETMIKKNGVGLAAIQIDEAKRVLIINRPLDIKSDDPKVIQPKENTLEIINPKIIEARGETKYEEGCLSVPGYYEEVDRFKYIKIEYYDRFGNKKTLEEIKDETIIAFLLLIVAIFINYKK